MSVADLLAEVRRAVLGQPLTGRWKDDHMPVRRRWMGGVSNNLPRLAEACVAAIRPDEAAAWWLELLEEEWGERGLWDAQEPRSRTYSGDTWAAEAATYDILRRRLPSHPVVEALRRSLVRRAADAALCALPSVTSPGARGQVVYRGTGVLWTGGRSNHFANHPADHVAHRALAGEAPPVESHGEELAELAETLRQRDAFALTADQRAALQRVVASGGADLEAVRQAVALLGPARTAAPVWTRRYADGTLACAVEWNPSSNTSCAFLVASRGGGSQDLGRDVTFLHPYGPHGRVRGETPLGDRILGRGETWWEGDVFACANLSMDQAAARKGERWELRHRLPPTSSLLWELRMGPDQAPRLTVGGVAQPVAPPPPGRPVSPPPPPAPSRPVEPPEPPEDDGFGWSIPGPADLRIDEPRPKQPLAFVADQQGAIPRLLELSDPRTKKPATFTLVSPAPGRALVVRGVGDKTRRHLLKATRPDGAPAILVVESHGDGQPLIFVRLHT
jgi:hypothetical protein